MKMPKIDPTGNVISDLLLPGGKEVSRIPKMDTEGRIVGYTVRFENGATREEVTAVHGLDVASQDVDPGNKLISLEGFPKLDGFDLSDAKLTSLEGFPKLDGVDLRHVELTALEGLPKLDGFDLSHAELTSLEGFHKLWDGQTYVESPSTDPELEDDGPDI